MKLAKGAELVVVAALAATLVVRTSGAEPEEAPAPAAPSAVQIEEAVAFAERHAAAVNGR